MRNFEQLIKGFGRIAGAAEILKNSVEHNGSTSLTRARLDQVGRFSKSYYETLKNELKTIGKFSLKDQEYWNDVFCDIEREFNRLADRVERGY